MAALQIFLSAVSAEFETYRPLLQDGLTARGRSVVIQEDFSASGTPTLDKLAAGVKESDVVVHLTGDLPGAMAAALAVTRAAAPRVSIRGWRSCFTTTPVRG